MQGQEARAKRQDPTCCLPIVFALCLLPLTLCRPLFLVLIIIGRAIPALQSRRANNA